MKNACGKEKKIWAQICTSPNGLIYTDYHSALSTASAITDKPTPELGVWAEGRVRAGGRAGSLGVERSPAPEPAEPKLEKRGVAVVWGWWEEGCKNSETAITNIQDNKLSGGYEVHCAAVYDFNQTASTENIQCI